MKTLGVILARGGSAGLKGKHLLDLLGRPVIDYTFGHAKSARRLTMTVVSSDCPRIRAAAAAAGFTAIDRPASLATGDASVQDVLLHALKTVEESTDFRADAVATLYGNVPVRPADIIDRALALLQQTGCDSVRSFCPVGKWHPAWMAWMDGDRVVQLEKNSIHRRQDLAPTYLHDGAIVASSRAALLRGLEAPNDPHAFFGTDRRGVMTAQGETVEIDHITDLFLAEALLRHRAGAAGCAA